MAAATPLCRCAEPAILRTSWTDANPGRRFFGCSNYGDGKACNYFRWIDPPLDENTKRVLLSLHKRIREMENRNNHSSFMKELVKGICIIVGAALAKRVVTYIFGNL